jgi:hypothetical protein
MSLASTHEKPGIFIPFDPVEKFSEAEYLSLAQKTLENYQTHKNQVPYEQLSQLSLFRSPATAVLVGTGTVGLEAIAYATRIMPLQSTLVILQNDVQSPEKLQNLLTNTLQGGDTFNWIISPPIDLGCIDQLESFLTKNKNALERTQLFIHTADKAKRHIPDQLPYKDVIIQILRRGSIGAIDELIERFSKPENTYVRLLFSSMCSVDRSEYRLANVGPYQMGKIVGDELFKSASVRNNSYSFILYSGGMFTMGETLTRNHEYLLLKQQDVAFEKTSEDEYTQQWKSASDHVDSMDSAGLMFKIIWGALQKGELQLGKLYSIYGSSVPKRLGHPLNTLESVDPAPYMFDSLDSSPTT